MATDQEIRDKGIKFLPKQKYLQNPYEFPVEEETAPVPGGITNTNAFNNSGGNDGFSVYNPDPNTISNQNYDPRPNYDAYYKDNFGTNLGDPEALTATGARYAEPSSSKFKEMLSQGFNFSPLGMAKRGFEFLGNKLDPYLPVNRRAIMENQLSGQGIMVNNIGQIVSDGGNINTAENIMAGYNAYKVDKDTFKKRRLTIEQNMKDPAQKKAKLDALAEAEARMLGTATTQTNKIFDFEEEEKNKNKNKKNKIINRYITKKKETKTAKDAQDIVDVEAVKAAIKKAEAATTNSGGFTYDTNTTGQASSNQYGTYTPSNTPQQAQDYQDSGRGQQTSAPTRSAPSRSSRHSSGPGGLHSYNKGGRAGYFFGGRARLQGGGGADMGAPEKAAERASKGYGTTPDTGSKSGTNDYSTTTQTQNNDRSIRDNQNPVPKESILNRTMDLGSELSYLNNLKNLNVLGIVGNIGVNKFRNYLDNRKTTEEDDKLSYNTNPLPTDNYFTEVQQKDLDASKMRGFKKQDYNSYLDQMNMLNDGTKVTPYEFQGLQDGSITTTGTFTAANGGRAMFKNGGLAGLL